MAQGRLTTSRRTTRTSLGEFEEGQVKLNVAFVFEGILQGDGGIWTKRPKVGFDVDENVLNRHHPMGISNTSSSAFSVWLTAVSRCARAGRCHHLRRVTSILPLGMLRC